jgi:hypothetical protein
MWMVLPPTEWDEKQVNGFNQLAEINRGQPDISQFEPLGEPKQCSKKTIQPFFALRSLP